MAVLEAKNWCSDLVVLWERGMLGSRRRPPLQPTDRQGVGVQGTWLNFDPRSTEDKVSLRRAFRALVSQVSALNLTIRALYITQPNRRLQAETCFPERDEGRRCAGNRIAFAILRLRYAPAHVRMLQDRGLKWRSLRRMPVQKCQSAAVHWLSHLAQFAEDIVSFVGGIAKTPHRHSQWLPSGVRVVLLCLYQRENLSLPSAHSFIFVCFVNLCILVACSTAASELFHASREHWLRNC